ncbi:MAG: hypothetical protein KZQ93_12695 [Candidatus Thiodiazotropha sp. (ex Monitilora ramsayi)]|nr:hypothetical protein [Candidatus Thiodiazotropha sp. (ex Monitilora ramsayi)]
MSIKHRLSRLEQKIGKTSDKHYVVVLGAEGETSREAIDRTLKKNKLTQKDIGQMVVIGHDYFFTEDYGGYENTRDLRGWKFVEELFKHVISKAQGTGLRPVEEEPFVE